MSVGHRLRPPCSNPDELINEPRGGNLRAVAIQGVKGAKEAVWATAPIHKQLNRLNAPDAGDSNDIRPDVEVPEDLGKLIRRDADLVRLMGWEALVRQRQGRGDMTDMRSFQHPA